METEAGRAVLAEIRVVAKAAGQRLQATAGGPEAFVGTPGLDRARGLALGETLAAIREAHVGHAVIADRQERAQRRGLERGGGLELGL